MEFNAYKVLRVDGDTANRDLGELIKSKVEELLQAEGGTLVDLRIFPDLSVTHGRALVTVFYNGPESKKSKK